MKESVCYRVELEFLDNSNLLLALDVDVANEYVRSINCLANLVERDSELCCYWQTVLSSYLTVNVTWDESLFAKSLCRLLARLGALYAIKSDFFNFVLL